MSTSLSSGLHSPLAALIVAAFFLGACQRSAPDPAARNCDPVSTSRIDSALLGYDGGDTVSIDSIGYNECLNIPFQRWHLANHLVLEGHNYNIYACSWRFEGAFRPVLGMAPGMPRTQVEALFGRPESSVPDTLTYRSEAPTGYERNYFDSRWQIKVVFRNGRVHGILFRPSFEDC